jgi:hypothetical protein
MTALSPAHIRLLKDYPRAVVHMRAQLNQKRFSLAFGAGLSKSFGLPNWATLVEGIAADPAVDGKKILDRLSWNGSLPYLTELLFQHFRQRQKIAGGSYEIGSPEFENFTVARWFEICRNHLYRDAKPDFGAALDEHPYLLRYLPIIQNTPITITYNFDDFIERALLKKKDPSDTTLGYETVTNPWTQFRRSDAVIYHPHGALPTELMEAPKDRLVFSESAYARLFLGALAGDFSFLLNHMSKNTCLTIGLSLGDEDLRNLLVQSAQSNPGNPHYYVHFVKPGEHIDPSEADAIRMTNFRVYNLVTLFLNDSEIAALADLLYCGHICDNDFTDRLIETDTCATFCFYLTGALGVGKSTTTTQLRNLTVLDEWAEPRPALLAKPWDELTPTELEEADNWIASQFKIKNDKLRHDKYGIALVDRPPLDPLAFTQASELPAKAKRLWDTISFGGKLSIANGTIILLVGDAKELAARVIATGRDGYTAAKLSKMEADLHNLYKGDGVRVIETRGRSIAEVAKMVSEIIHFDEYRPFNFTECLDRFK